MPTFQPPVPTQGPYELGPEAHPQPGVPVGAITKYAWLSEIFPGTTRDYWLYVPAQYKPETPASVMVFQDGWSYLNPEGKVRAAVVMDNLIHQKQIPVMIGLFVNPGLFPPAGPSREPVKNRSFEYDTLSDQYARFIIEELLAETAKGYNLTQQADGRAICGASSGGICAWTAAWHRPDYFSKVMSHVGSFTDIRGGHAYPSMIRKNPKKNIRVYLQAGANDLDNYAGHWPMANLQMAAALAYAGYDYHLEYGSEAHNYIHGGACFPQAMRWLWRDTPAVSG
jgi:enterochelin esterase family protein